MRDLVIPEWAQKIIREHEEKLTKELRELTGRDDISAKFDVTPILSESEGAAPK